MGVLVSVLREEFRWEGPEGPGVPGCPAHPGSLVVRAGHARRKGGVVQRFRCRSADGFVHLFVPGPGSTWTRSPLGVRVVCRWHEGSRVARHGFFVSDGVRFVRFLCSPVSADRHTFSVAQDLLEGRAPGVVRSPERRPVTSVDPAVIGAALCRVGAGEPVLRVAQSLRTGVPWRVVAGWVEEFSPAVRSAVLPSAWPAELLVGFTPLAASSSQGVLVAAERTGEQQGALLLARVIPEDTPDAWQEFFSELDGAPCAVVGDDRLGARVGLVQAFGATVEWRSSQYHVRARLRALARSAGMDQPGDAVVGALKSVSAFARFRAFVETAFPGTALDGYVRGLGDDLSRQLAQIAVAPGFASTSSAMTGPLSEPLVRALVSRRGRLSHPARLRGLLDLMVAHQRGVDDPALYGRVVARELAARPGR